MKARKKYIRFNSRHFTILDSISTTCYYRMKLTHDSCKYFVLPFFRFANFFFVAVLEAMSVFVILVCLHIHNTLLKMSKLILELDKKCQVDIEEDHQLFENPKAGQVIKVSIRLGPV